MQEYISNKILRKFGFFVGIGLPVLVGLILPLFSGHAFRYWTLWIGLPLLFMAILKPALLFYPYKFWMSIGHILGWINSRIILGLIFVIILLPLSLIMKVLGYDPLMLKTNKLSTYKKERPNHKINLKKIF